MNTLSREVPIEPAHAALLIIDVQNYCTRPEVGASEYFHCSLRDTVLPNIRRLQSACRTAAIEIVYSVIENMTRDGRDRSLDYKISGIDVSRGSRTPKCSTKSLRPTTRLSSARRRAVSLSPRISTMYCTI